MPDMFVAMVFGFPAVFISLIVSVIGVLKEKFWLVIIGAVLFIPFSYYLNGAAHNNGLPFLLPLLMMGSAAAVREMNKLWAWILLVPSFLASLWIVIIAVFYQFV